MNTEQNFMKTQQIESHAAQQVAAELNAQRQVFQAVHTRLPRLYNRSLPYIRGNEITQVTAGSSELHQRTVGDRLLEHFYFTTA